MSRKQQDVDDSGLLEGLDERAARRVRAEARVLEVLLDVHDKMEERAIGTRMLARLLGASAGQVSRWLKAETGIHARTMFLLADALGYDLHIEWRRRDDKAASRAVTGENTTPASGRSGGTVSTRATTNRPGRRSAR